jgi:predicted PurR-regulated permease PerM
MTYYGVCNKGLEDNCVCAEVLSMTWELLASALDKYGIPTVVAIVAVVGLVIVLRTGFQFFKEERSKTDNLFKEERKKSEARETRLEKRLDETQAINRMATESISTLSRTMDERVGSLEQRLDIGINGLNDRFDKFSQNMKGA